MNAIRYICLVILTCSVALPVLADHAKDHKRGHTPEQAFVYQVSEEVLETVNKSGGEAEAERYLEGVFLKYVDIDWVGQFVLGRHWRTASEQQREAFVKYYRAFMVHSYTDRLLEYSGEHYDVGPPVELGKGRKTLTMQLYRGNGAPILIDYKIRQSDNGFQIYDLVVEGISLITTQRSEFASVIDRKGLDFLVSLLKKKSQS